MRQGGLVPKSHKNGAYWTRAHNNKKQIIYSKNPATNQEKALQAKAFSITMILGSLILLVLILIGLLYESPYK